MKKIIKKVIQFILAIVIIIALIAGGTGYNTYKDIKAEKNMEDIIEEIRGREGYVKLKDISKDLLEATVAIEDMRFYEHGAIEIRSLFRAVLANIKSKELVQGGSTITQQVVKNIYFDHSQSIDRKIPEMLLAFDLENILEKDEILELYVNLIYYGDNNYGIGEASKGYFNKEASELTYDEATLLAGLPQAPSLYALSENMDMAKERQEAVIKALEEYRALD